MAKSVPEESAGYREAFGSQGQARLAATLTGTVTNESTAVSSVAGNRLKPVPQEDLVRSRPTSLGVYAFSRRARHWPHEGREGTVPASNIDPIRCHRHGPE